MKLLKNCQAAEGLDFSTVAASQKVTKIITTVALTNNRLESGKPMRATLRAILCDMP
jgi:hypothetical protein